MLLQQRTAYQLFLGFEFAEAPLDGGELAFALLSEGRGLEQLGVELLLFGIEAG